MRREGAATVASSFVLAPVSRTRDRAAEREKRGGSERERRKEREKKEENKREKQKEKKKM